MNDIDLLDYYASSAMQGMLSNISPELPDGNKRSAIVSLSFNIALSMIQEKTNIVEKLNRLKMTTSKSVFINVDNTALG